MKKFVHLHVHTEYSLLDGLSRISKLLDYVKNIGMESIAITDHGAMYGVIEFYKMCIKEGIKPIIGMEAYITDTSLDEKPERSKTKNYHLILLANTNEGYKNLMKLTSIAHMRGYYYRPRIDRNTLEIYHKGLICTSACFQGEIAKSILDGDYRKAKDTANWYLNVFENNYFLEIQRHEFEKFSKSEDNSEIKRILQEQSDSEKIINTNIIKLSREMGIPLIATNDCHYIKREDAEAQDALVCISTGKLVSDIKRVRYIDSPTYYVKTGDEMYGLFSDVPDSIENTVKIAEKCNVNITLNKWFFPKFKLEEGKTIDQEFEEKSYEGIIKRIQRLSPEIKERLDYEIDIIKNKGYSTYFLIVADVAQWCTENGIITNTRGSTAGSLVAYALGIVNINPLNYELPFERFLTPWRPSPPDIDFDIADDRREEVIEYITKRYGGDKVAQICTFGRMMARGSVRDIARVLGYPYSVGDRISKLIPIGSQGFPMSIEKALEITPDLKVIYEEKDSKNIIDLARKVEGNARHISVHAAGVVIAPDIVTKFTPIQLDPEGMKVITQYDMDALDPNVSPGEAIGLLKFDLLGLRNLSILGAAINIIQEKNNIKIEILKIPLDDKKTFQMLAKGDTMGVFQLSGSGMTRYLKDLKPTRVEDLMAMVALYRPGPMAQIPEYILRKNNSDKIQYFDERMKEFLSKSYGLMVYQDDVFLTAIKIAGYTWEEADKFRKAVGKKIPQEMEKQKNKFIDGAVKNGMTEDRAKELFKLIEPFSGYGFNKAHAASYGMVAYWTAYLKANYPVEYMAALLTAESKDADKVSAAINECRRMGIKVLPPDINESRIGFKIIKESSSLGGNAIRFGLDAIKNVGNAAIENILEARKKSRFSSFKDFLIKVDARKVNKKVLESLIKVGAMQSFGSRALLLSSIDKIRSAIPKKNDFINQEGLFNNEELSKSNNITLLYEGNIDEFSEDELQNLERQLLGFSLSAKPINEVLQPFENLTTHKIQEIINENIEVLSSVRIAAIISEIRVILTKKSGQEMAFVKVQDGTGTIELVIFPSVYKDCRHLLIDNKALLISGKVDIRNEEPSLLVNEIHDKENISLGKNDRLFIKIPKNLNIKNLKYLKKLFLENPGSNYVTLIFEGQNKKSIDLKYKIKYDEVIAKQIDEIINDKNYIN